MLLYFFASAYLEGNADKYQYSIYLLVSFLGGALALMRMNQYPSQIFIGDTFCYFAGIVLAIAAILGTLSSTQEKSQLCVTGSSYPS